MLKILMVFLSMLVDLAPHEKESTSTTDSFYFLPLRHYLMGITLAFQNMIMVGF